MVRIRACNTLFRIRPCTKHKAKSYPVLSRGFDNHHSWESKYRTPGKRFDTSHGQTGDTFFAVSFLWLDQSRRRLLNRVLKSPTATADISPSKSLDCQAVTASAVGDMDWPCLQPSSVGSSRVHGSGGGGSRSDVHQGQVRSQFDACWTGSDGYSGSTSVFTTLICPLFSNCYTVIQTPCSFKNWILNDKTSLLLNRLNILETFIVWLVLLVGWLSCQIDDNLVKYLVAIGLFILETSFIERVTSPFTRR